MPDSDLSQRLLSQLRFPCGEVPEPGDICEDPADVPRSDPPAEPPSRKPWADARPIPAMSATVPNKSSFLIFVRVIF